MPAPHPLYEQIDWPAACDEATLLFQELLRIDTTNPPGAELAAASFLAEVLAKDGIESTVLESAPGRGNIIARLKGDGSGGEPILLSGHLDVVPADSEHWEHPPFAGEIHDGVLWGRGAIDMKNMVAMEVMTLLLLKRQGAKLSRDLIFAGVADEEAGCEYGSRWLAREHPELIQGEYAISEIGGFTLHMNGSRLYPVQVAEKGMCWFTIKATGTPGHGALPNDDNPIVKLAKAALILGEARLPMHRCKTIDDFVQQLASRQPFPSSVVLKQLTNPLLSDLILEKAFPDKGLAKTFYANLHNTANPTMLKAGVKVNQVPGEASMRVDGRTIPGQDGAALIREVEALIGPGFEITIDQELPPIEGDPSDPIAALIEAVLEHHDPGCIPIYTMIPGFTDAKAYDELGMKCWGFSPVQLGPEMNFAAMFHGHNERIPVQGFHFGTRVLFDLVSRMVVLG